MIEISQFIIKGIFIGFIFGVPAGAIGALTIQRTIEKGFLAGFVTGIGSSIADLLYSAVGVFGITIISDFLEKYQEIIQRIGGIFIIILGFKIVQKKQQVIKPKETRKGNLFLCFLSSFGTAIMNPATILSFMIAFTAFDITGTIELFHGFALMFGIFIGTLIWWFMLSWFVCVFRKKITDKIYLWLHRILGSFMIILGMTMIVKTIV